MPAWTCAVVGDEIRVDCIDGTSLYLYSGVPAIVASAFSGIPEESFPARHNPRDNFRLVGFSLLLRMDRGGVVLDILPGSAARQRSADMIVFQ